MLWVFILFEKRKLSAEVMEPNLWIVIC